MRATLWIALSLVIALGFFRYLSVAFQIFHEANPGFDFLSYYTAALALRDNPAANIYDLRVLQAAAAHHATVAGQVYMYPPLLAVALIPFTRLPWNIAFDAWTVLNMLLWLASAGLTAGLLRSIVLEARGPAAARLGVDTRLFLFGCVAFMTLTFDPVATGAGLGQVDIIVWFLTLLALALDRRGRPALAGAALTVAALLKVYPLILLGYYLVRGRWRVVRGGAVTLALLILGMLPVLGLQGILQIRGLFAAGDTAIISAHNEALLRAPLWLAILAGDRTDTPVAIPGSALVGLVLLAFVAGVLCVSLARAPLSASWAGVLLSRLRLPLPTIGAQRASSGDAANAHAARTGDAIGYLWALCTMVLVAPVAWEHTYTWLLPPLVIGFGYVVLTYPVHSRKTAVLVAAIVLSYAVTTPDYPLGFDISEQFTLGPILFGHPLRPFFMVLRPLGALLLWATMGWLFFRASRMRRPENTTVETPLTSSELAPPLTSRRLAVVLVSLLGAVVLVRCVIIAIMAIYGPTYGPTALLR